MTAAWAQVWVNLFQCGIIAYWLWQFECDLRERKRINDKHGERLEAMRIQLQEQLK